MLWLLSLAMVALAGCHPQRVVTPMPTRAAFHPGRPVTLIVPALVSDLPGKARTPRYADIPRRLVQLFVESGAAAMEERDVTGPPALDSWVVRVELTAIHMGSNPDETEIEFEVSVFDASGAVVERVATEAGIVLMVDTSSRAPTLRERFELPMATSYGSRASSGAEAEAYEEAFSQTLTALLFNRLAFPLAGALERTPPRVQEVEAVSPVVVPAAP